MAASSDDEEKETMHARIVWRRLLSSLIHLNLDTKFKTSSLRWYLSVDLSFLAHLSSTYLSPSICYLSSISLSIFSQSISIRRCVFYMIQATH